MHLCACNEVHGSQSSDLTGQVINIIPINKGWVVDGWVNYSLIRNILIT